MKQTQGSTTHIVVLRPSPPLPTRASPRSLRPKAVPSLQQKGRLLYLIGPSHHTSPTTSPPRRRRPQRQQQPSTSQQQARRAPCPQSQTVPPPRTRTRKRRNGRRRRSAKIRNARQWRAREPPTRQMFRFLLQRRVKSLQLPQHPIEGQRLQRWRRSSLLLREAQARARPRLGNRRGTHGQSSCAWHPTCRLSRRIFESSLVTPRTGYVLIAGRLSCTLFLLYFLLLL